MENLAKQMNRREFFFKGGLIGGLGLLGTVLAWIFGDLWTAASRFSSARWVSLAPLNRFPLESVIPYPEYKVAILRREKKIGAISLECTHLGCLLNTVDRGFFCPCHGSDFGPLGQVYSGPAASALPWHEVVNQGGRIWVHLGRKLDQPLWLEAETSGDGSEKRSR
jgi:nitrite reductase/ring-hydroxylating ferredoxin subunit